MGAGRERAVDRAGAVLEERPPTGSTPSGRSTARPRPACSALAFEERHRLVEDRRVAGDVEVVATRRTAARARRRRCACGRRGPSAGATSAGRRPRRTGARPRAGSARAADPRRVTAKARHVLELVAEAVRAARLVERAAAPEPARERLIEEPAVDEEVERRVGRLDLQPAEHAVPEPPDLPQRRVDVLVPLRRHQAPGLGRVPRLAEEDAHLAAPFAARARSGAAAPRTGRAPRPMRPESARPGASPEGSAAEPLRPRNSVRSAVNEVGATSSAANATASGIVVVPRIARVQRARLGVERRDDEPGRTPSGSRRGPTRRRTSPRASSRARTGSRSSAATP